MQEGANPVCFQWTKSLRGPEDTGQPQQAKDRDREGVRRAGWGGESQAIPEEIWYVLLFWSKGF